MKKRNPQLKFLKDGKKSYGGDLLKTRKGRATARPLDTKNTMHLVLRSTKAKGDWSFKKPKNEVKIREIVERFSRKYGIRILSLANVGNHLHFQIKLGNRFAYRPFIRAITAAIAMAVTGSSRWNPTRTREALNHHEGKVKDRFWDYRPFTRVVLSYLGFLNMKDYVQINQLEGFGVSRIEARFILANRQNQRRFYSG